MPIQHFSDVTTLSSIHLVRMDPTQKFVRRHQHDQTSAQIRTPADLASHHAQNTPVTHLWLRMTMCLELLAQIVLSSSILLHCSSLAASDPLLPTWMSSHSILFVLVFCDFTARCVRMSNRHLLITSVPAFHKYIPLHLAQLELFSSLSLPLSHRFCLCMYSSLLFPSKFSQ